MILKREKGCPKWMWHFQSSRKKVGWDSGRFGLFRYGNYEFGAENEIGFDCHGVYQRRRRGDHWITVKMRFQITRETVATPKRIAVRTKYKAAYTAWRGLTEQQKDVYNERSKEISISGYQLFVKEYMLS